MEESAADDLQEWTQPLEEDIARLEAQLAGRSLASELRVSDEAAATIDELEGRVSRPSPSTPLQNCLFTPESAAIQG